MQEINTIDIDLFMPAAADFGLYAGNAQITADPISRRMIALRIMLERGHGANLETRTIDCLAGSDAIAYDDKPVAAHAESIASAWLAGPDGQCWLDKLKPTDAELMHMARESAAAAAFDARFPFGGAAQ